MSNTIPDIELELKRTELALKATELEAKKTEKLGAFSVSSPLTIAVMTGVLGLIGAGVANIIQLRSNLELERQKLESSLILKAIETGNPDASAKNLLFLLDMKLISDPSGSIAKLKANPEQAPVLSGSSAPVPSSPSGRQVFFDEYRKAFGRLSQNEVSVLTQLFDFFGEDKEVTDVRHVAYILATIKWQTAHTWTPLTEAGSDEFFERKYGPDTAAGKAYGHVEPGDGSRFKGRGYILLTGRSNYTKLNERLGFVDTENDLVKHPEKALEPLIAYRVTSVMMREGLATGRKLDEFISGERADYEQARRIVSGLDQSPQIAEIARKFDAMLRASLQSEPAGPR